MRPWSSSSSAGGESRVVIVPASYVVRARLARTYEGPNCFADAACHWLEERFRGPNAVHATPLATAEARPFTVSSLGGEIVATSGGGLRACAGAYCRFRWTALDPHTEAISDEIAAHLPGQRIMLGPIEVEVDAVQSREQEDVWAGRATYEEIWDSNATREEPLLVLSFQSPTTVPLQRNTRALPLPELVFGSLMDKWQRWGPVDLSGIRAALSNRVDLEYFRIEARPVRAGRRPETAFMGTVGYSLRRLDPLLRGALHALGAYAFYAGVGARTVAGYGQVRRAWPARAPQGHVLHVREARSAAAEDTGGPVVTVRYAIHAAVLPPLERAVAVGHQVRRAVTSLYGRIYGGQVPTVLSGKIGARPAQGHRHAFYLPVDEDNDGLVDHVWVHAPEGFDANVLEVLGRLDHVRWAEREEVGLLRLVALERLSRSDLQVPGRAVAPALAALAGPSRHWVSAVPYVMTRFPKVDHRGWPKRNPDGTQRDGPDDQVLREWNERRQYNVALPPLTKVETLPADHRQLTSFQLTRPGGGLSSGLAAMLSLEFAEPVTGPLALGYGCHYGLGLMRAEGSHSA
jgi:CRISPR/Cas system endoribonuclease Cas6 (RAMP superfamily)